MSEELRAVLKAMQATKLMEPASLEVRLRMADLFAPVKLRRRIQRLHASAERAKQRERATDGREAVLHALFPED